LVTEATGAFGSTAGSVAYALAAERVTISWSNPFVGRNTYRIDAAPLAGGRTGCVCGGDDDEANADVTFTVVPAERVTAGAFRPSTNGFAFTNSWSDDPLMRVRVVIAEIPIGKASNGLCGGMTFAVRDLFEARRAPPAMTTSPPDGDPWRTFVVDRLIASFDLPGGVVPYIRFMSTHCPIDDRAMLATLGGQTSRAAMLARRTWPQVKQTIDSGHPCPLGLVMIASDDVHDLRHQHQVMAYAYRVAGSQVTMWVYDPNSPLDDDVTIAFDSARTDQPIAVTHDVDSDGPLLCAFALKYATQTPPR
jgi:hypothetical protein